MRTAAGKTLSYSPPKRYAYRADPDRSEPNGVKAAAEIDTRDWSPANYVPLALAVLSGKPESTPEEEVVAAAGAGGRKKPTKAHGCSCSRSCSSWPQTAARPALTRTADFSTRAHRVVKPERVPIEITSIPRRSETSWAPDACQSLSFRPLCVSVPHLFPPSVSLSVQLPPRVIPLPDLYWIFTLLFPLVRVPSPVPFLRVPFL